MIEILPLTFGGGIERAGGIAVTGPEVMELLDNVRLLDGRVVPRFGMEARGEVDAAGLQYIAGGCAERTSQQGVIVVGFSALSDFSDHLLKIYRTDGDGLSPTLVGTFVDPCESAAETRCILAASGSRVFIAHNEASLALRAPTQYFNGDGNTLTTLTAAWAVGSGSDDDIRFSFVYAYRDYLIGLGFGTNTDEDEGLNMARLSDPGDPITFQELSWVKAGQYGERLVACWQLGTGETAVLLLIKEIETWVLTGYDGDTFQVYPMDGMFGAASGALVVGDGSDVYVWSLEGPRRFRGIGPGQDISWPLGLPWPTARDIEAEGLISQGFAAYVPQRGGGAIMFVFGTLAYVFDLRTERWSHFVLGQNSRCAFMLYGAEAGYEGPSRGYPDASDDPAYPSAEDEVTCTFDNILSEGDETVELWFREVGDPWPGVATDTQPITDPTRFVVGSLTADTDYEFALRYVRDSQYSPGYTSADPDDWPAVSKGTRSTTAVGGGPPTMTAPENLNVSRSYECVPDSPPAAEPCTPSYVFNLAWENTMDDAQVVVETFPPAEAWVELVELAIGTESYEHTVELEPNGRLYRVKHRKTVAMVDYDSDPSNEDG